LPGPPQRGFFPHLSFALQERTLSKDNTTQAAQKQALVTGLYVLEGKYFFSIFGHPTTGVPFPQS
jgi:hypothetical protein